MYVIDIVINMPINALMIVTMPSDISLDGNENLPIKTISRHSRITHMDNIAQVKFFFINSQLKMLLFSYIVKTWS